MLALWDRKAKRARATVAEAEDDGSGEEGSGDDGSDVNDDGSDVDDDECTQLLDSIASPLYGWALLFEGALNGDGYFGCFRSSRHPIVGPVVAYRPRCSRSDTLTTRCAMRRCPL